MTALVGPSGTEAPTPATRTGVAGAHTGFRFRPDIEGFRAVGVLLVVLFHASVPHLTGGFVGVDVFFVISGFLICSLLVQEHFRFGDISLRGFYARRARRIIPPAAAVIAASTLVIGFTQGSVDAVRGAVDFGSALLYLANWHFIAQGNNYLAGDASNSPALHLWSLSVEEQFYVVFPLLLVLSFALVRFVRMSAVRIAAAVVGASCAVSLAAGVVLTASDPGYAYLATWARAWQFGAGALLALMLVEPPGRASRRQGLVRSTLSWAGLAAVLAAATWFGPDTPYPGVAALVPTLGSAAVIAGGGGPGSCATLLSSPVMRWIGRLSYSWYLWHWPVLVVAKTWMPDLGLLGRLGLMLAALGLAWLTYAVVERPCMTTTTLRHDVSGSFSLGLAASAIAATCALGPAAYAVHVESADTTAIPITGMTWLNSTVKGGPVTPSASAALHDGPHPGECNLDRSTVVPADCSFGPLSGTPVVLFGDSHAFQWVPALQQMSSHLGWRVSIRTQAGCPVADYAALAGPQARLSDPACIQFRNDVLALVTRSHPRVVIVSSFGGYVQGRDQIARAWAGPLAELASSGARIVYLRDTPKPVSDVPTCVARHLSEWSACTFDRWRPPDPVAERARAGLVANVGVVDMFGYLCPDSHCPAVRGGVLLYRDDSHITATASRLLAPALEAELRKAGVTD